MKIKTGILSLLMILGGLLAFWLVPRSSASGQPVDLASMVPARFGSWHVLPDVRLVTAQEPNSLERELYSQVFAQAYTDDHHVVMLLLAYGPSQTDRLQLHRPEICYVANGFRVGNVTPTAIDIAGDPNFPVKRLLARREDRVEYITYWMRIGDKIANDVFGRQIIKLQYGLQGVIPDGLLVRTSVVGSSAQDAYSIQTAFINALAQNASVRLRAQLLGHRPINLANN